MKTRHTKSKYNENEELYDRSTSPSLFGFFFFFFFFFFYILSSISNSTRCRVESSVYILITRPRVYLIIDADHPTLRVCCYYAPTGLPYLSDRNDKIRRSEADQFNMQYFTTYLKICSYHPTADQKSFDAFFG